MAKDLVSEIRDTNDEYGRSAMLGFDSQQMKFGLYIHSVMRPAPEDAPLISKYVPAALQPIAYVLAGAHILSSPFDHHEQAAVDLERKTGITGISGKYNMPEGLTELDVEKYVRSISHGQLRRDISPEEAKDKMTRLVTALEEINPSLKSLQYDRGDTQKMKDVALGASSRFNTDDIQSYLSGNVYYKMRQDKDYAELMDKIAEKTGKLQWVPTMDTLKKIDQQISPAPAARASGPKSPRM